MPTLHSEHSSSTVAGIPGYTDAKGHLTDHEVDSICLEYANGNSDLALEIKFVVGDFIRQNPLISDLRERSEVAHPSLQHNAIVIQTLGMILSNRIVNPYDPESLKTLKEELAEKLDSGTNKDLTNPGYCDANGHLLDEGVDAVCLSYSKQDDKVAKAMRILVGNYIKMFPAFTDIRQYLDSYTTRQRIGFMTLSKIAASLKESYENRPEEIESVLTNPALRENLQRNIFNLLSLAQNEQGHLTRHDAITLPITTGLIKKLLLEGTSDAFALEIENATQGLPKSGVQRTRYQRLGLDS